MKAVGEACAPRRSTLALAMVTEGPARHVEATVETLRRVVDEVVLLIDDRAPPRDAAALRDLADVSRTVTFDALAAHLDDLHDLASTEWVLRLDSDEYPSSALLRRLPSLVSDERFQQWAIRRTWIFPDPDRWLDEVPWAPDFQLRLLRRETAAPGRLAVHEQPTIGYVNEAIYHLNCVTSTQEERQVKALLHDVMRPEVQIAGQHPSHAIYEPERYATRPPATVPPEDADALRTVVSGRQRA